MGLGLVGTLWVTETALSGRYSNCSVDSRVLIAAQKSANQVPDSQSGRDGRQRMLADQRFSLNLEVLNLPLQFVVFKVVFAGLGKLFEPLLQGIKRCFIHRIRWVGYVVI
jgi:hypothetical protein